MIANPNGLSQVDRKLRSIALVIGRLALGYLFFTQLWWKTPPTFGCPPDFAFTTTGSDGRLSRTSGLCDWIGIESISAKTSRPFFVADLGSVGGPRLSINLGPLARANGAFIDGFVKPNIRWFGYVVWGTEAFIFISMFFGLFSRLGGLAAVCQSAQLMIGLAGISNPAEWEWSYNLLVALSILMFALTPGRVFGLDVPIRKRLRRAVESGNRLAGALLWLT